MNLEKICQKYKNGNGKNNKIMELVYKNQSIMTTTTNNKDILKYHFQKLYYAIIINNCNRYSSIANKQRIDIIMTNDNLEILSYKRQMHENTFYENTKATKTILLPLNYFQDIEVGEFLQIKEKQKNNNKELLVKHIDSSLSTNN